MRGRSLALCEYGTLVLLWRLGGECVSALLACAPLLLQSSIISSYSPSALITWLHGRDRYGHPSTFEAGTNMDWMSYQWGVAFATVIFVAFAVVLFKVAMFMYCGACCHCCFNFVRKKSVAQGGVWWRAGSCEWPPKKTLIFVFGYAENPCVAVARDATARVCLAGAGVNTVTYIVVPCVFVSESSLQYRAPCWSWVFTFAPVSLPARTRMKVLSGIVIGLASGIIIVAIAASTHVTPTIDGVRDRLRVSRSAAFVSGGCIAMPSWCSGTSLSRVCLYTRVCVCGCANACAPCRSLTWWTRHIWCPAR